MKWVRYFNSEDLLILSSLILCFAGLMLGALLESPHIFGITVLVVMCVLLIGWGVIRSPRLSWLLLFGFVTGVLELWADWVHVMYLESLVYTDYFGFQLLASPAYMPLGWWLTVVQFGYLALRLNEYWPLWVSVSVVAVSGMSLPPWYEQFATPARAWYYTTSGPMLSHTPVWIIFTYGGCMFAIATMALSYYRPQSWGTAVVAGIFAGAGIMFSGVFWFALFA